MPGLPILKVTEVIQTLLRAGFRIARIRGSHYRFEHLLSKRGVSVSFHPGDVSRKMLRSILRQAGMSVREFMKYLRGR